MTLDRITLSEIEKRIKNEFRSKETKTVPLRQALYSSLADDIISPTDIPPFDTSEKDGYAVKSSDIAKASNSKPVLLSVSQTIIPGQIPKALEPHTCARVLTGAWLPYGSDSVVMQEQVSVKSNIVSFSRPAEAGQNIYPRGADISKNEVILQKGRFLKEEELNILYSINYKRVKIYPRLKVSVISTGSELVPMESVSPGKIPDTNRPLILSLVRRSGFYDVDGGIVPDKSESIQERTKSLLRKSDALIITGGSSVGTADLTVSSLLEAGAKVLFHGVKLRPSSTAAVASWNNKPIFVFSGLIQSSLVAFFTIALPTLRQIQGIGFHHRTVQAILEEDFQITGEEDFMRAVWVKLSEKEGIINARPMKASSHSREVFVECSGIILSKGGEILRKGSKVNVILTRCIANPFEEYSKD